MGNQETGKSPKTLPHLSDYGENKTHDPLPDEKTVHATRHSETDFLDWLALVVSL